MAPEDRKVDTEKKAQIEADYKREHDKVPQWMLDIEDEVTRYTVMSSNVSKDIYDKSVKQHKQVQEAETQKEAKANAQKESATKIQKIARGFLAKKESLAWTDQLKDPKIAKKVRELKMTKSKFQALVTKPPERSDPIMRSTNTYLMKTASLITDIRGIRLDIINTKGDNISDKAGGSETPEFDTLLSEAALGEIFLPEGQTRAPEAKAQVSAKALKVLGATVQSGNVQETPKQEETQARHNQYSVSKFSTRVSNAISGFLTQLRKSGSRQPEVEAGMQEAQNITSNTKSSTAEQAKGFGNISKSASKSSNPLSRAFSKFCEAAASGYEAINKNRSVKTAEVRSAARVVNTAISKLLGKGQGGQ